MHCGCVDYTVHILNAVIVTCGSDLLIKKDAFRQRIAATVLHQSTIPYYLNNVKTIIIAIVPYGATQVYKHTHTRRSVCVCVCVCVFVFVCVYGQYNILRHQEPRRKSIETQKMSCTMNMVNMKQC